LSPRGIVVAMVEKNKTRIRQYANNYKGEIIVLIHAAGDGLHTKSIYKHLFGQYKFITHITLVNKNKIKVLFGEKENRLAAIKEANSLAKCGVNSCNVYIPAKFVEVQGVVSWPVQEKIDEFTSHGKGKFRNSNISEVKVLDSIRLKRKANVASSEQILEDTSIVIVTFQGNLLPDTLELDRMLIPVREYRRREMFCENCRFYGHTKKYCNNKKLDHPTYLCIPCQTNNHLGGSNQCPRRKVLEHKHIMTMRKLRKRTFAEILQEIDPEAQVHEAPATITAAPMSFPTRRQEVAQKHAKKSEAVFHQPQKISKSTKSTQQSNKYPPGFKKPGTQTNNQYSTILKTSLNDTNLPPWLQEIIETYVVPYIDELVEKFIDHCKEKMFELFSPIK
jgi:hypothetical protein